MHPTGCLRKEKAFLLFRLVSSDLTQAKSPRPKYNASTIACQFVLFLLVLLLLLLLHLYLALKIYIKYRIPLKKVEAEIFWTF